MNERSMTMEEYHVLAMRTSPRDGHDKLDNGMLGMLGETGEIIDLVKKFFYQSSPEAQLPAQALLNELGDVLWYLEELADGMDSSMHEIGGISFEKLDLITGRVQKMPPLRRQALRLSDAAHEIRRAIEYRQKDKMKEAMKHALMDAAWLARIAGATIEEAAVRNIEKLKARYPKGFDAGVSMKRCMEEYGHEEG